MIEKLSKGSFIEYYEQRMKQFQTNAQRVGYKNVHAQEIRFQQLSKILLPVQKEITINDIGCALGGLYDFLKNNIEFEFTYRGYDILESMIQGAKDLHKGEQNASFHVMKEVSDIEEANFSIASGIFNLKYDIPEPDWKDYIESTLHAIYQKSTHGFAFNMLTSYSDKDKMEPILHYAEPCFYFDYCKRNFSKNVALLHDYEEYDFTILVRK